ncbi:hypothetical protein Q3G72_007978 [Acer saccharum]|nr:hypothetical protein Q3G72_007978 [Acer saccharum]
MPLCPMHRQENDMALMVDKFQTLISDYNVAGFVVRLPTDLSPTKHDPAITRQHVGDFVKELSKSRKLRGFKYAYWDDLATLKNMDFALKHHVEFVFEHLNLSEEVSKEIMDKLAATRVLQAYLDCVNTVVEIDKEKEYLVRRAWDEYVKEGSSMSIGLFPLGHVFQLMSRGDHVDSCLVMATKRHLGSEYGFPNVASQAGVLKIVKTCNIKGVLIGTNDEAKFDGSEKKTKAFVENFEYDESEDFEEGLCACINELGNDLEFYYQLIEASREKLFWDRFLDLEHDNNEWSSLPHDSFSRELGNKGSLRMSVPPSTQIPKRHDLWFGLCLVGIIQLKTVKRTTKIKVGHDFGLGFLSGMWVLHHHIIHISEVELSKD